MPTPDALLAAYTTWMRAAGFSATTVKARLVIVRRIADATGAHPAAFTSVQIAQWMAGWTNPHTLSTYYRAIGAWHRWLLLAGHRADDPMTGLRRPRKPKQHPHPVSTPSLRRLLASDLPPHVRAMLLLAIFAGLRVHEIGKVRGADFDLEASTLRVLGKGGVHATLPLHPRVADLAERMPRSGPWFPSPVIPRRTVAAHTVSKNIAEAMRGAGCAGSAHGLRHWYATQLLREGADVRVVQTLMRHADLSTTAGYLLVIDADRHAAVHRLPSLGIVAVAMDAPAADGTPGPATIAPGPAAGLTSGQLRALAAQLIAAAEIAEGP